MIKVYWDRLSKDDKELMLKVRNIIDVYNDDTVDATQVTKERYEFVNKAKDLLNYLESFEKTHDDVIGHILKTQRHILENFVVNLNTPNVIKITRKKKLDSIFNE
jgi:hypothetical protein